MSKTTAAVLVVAGTALAILFVWFAFFRGAPAAGAYDVFAQCLRDKGAVMYGAEWCPHCQNQKKAFGSSFKIIEYVECPKDPKRCIAEKIEGYPTWKFPDGRMLVGEQSLQALAEAASCALPTTQ